MPIIYMVRLLPWVIIQINFTLQHLIYLVLRKTLNCLTEISLTLISYLFQHVSIDLYFSNKVWTLLPWQTMCGNFLMKDKKKWKGLLYASHSTACWGRGWLRKAKGGPVARAACQTAAGLPRTHAGHGEGGTVARRSPVMVPFPPVPCPLQPPTCTIQVKVQIRHWTQTVILLMFSRYILRYVF